MGLDVSVNRFNELVSKFNDLKPIFVIGDVGIDKYTQGVVNRISPEAPVPLIEVKKEWLKLGLAANISDNLKALGIKSTLCGIVGDDQNADVFENLLEESDLSTWGVVRCDERPTVFKERVVTDMQQICRIDYESKKDISPSVEKKVIARVRDLSEEHDAVILEDYAKGTFTKTLTPSLISELKEKNVFIAVDPSRTTPPMYYKGVHLLKPNRSEAELMAKSLGYEGEFDIEKVAHLLVEKLELEKLIITLGAQGMAMIDTKLDDKTHFIPTVANEVYDVSGAGDTAISLIVSALMSGASLKEAAWISNCGSGVVVGKKGTATVSTDELKAHFEFISKKFNH